MRRATRTTIQASERPCCFLREQIFPYRKQNAVIPKTGCFLPATNGCWRIPIQMKQRQAAMSVWPEIISQYNYCCKPSDFSRAFSHQNAFPTLTVLILIAAVADFGAPHPKPKQQNLRHTRFCVAFVAAVENPILLRSLTYISAPFTHSFAAKRTRFRRVLFAVFEQQSRTSGLLIIPAEKQDSPHLRILLFYSRSLDASRKTGGSIRGLCGICRRCRPWRRTRTGQEYYRRCRGTGLRSWAWR